METELEAELEAEFESSFSNSLWKQYRGPACDMQEVQGRKLKFSTLIGTPRAAE